MGNFAAGKNTVKNNEIFNNIKINFPVGSKFYTKKYPEDIMTVAGYYGDMCITDSENNKIWNYREIIRTE